MRHDIVRVLISSFNRLFLHSQQPNFVIVFRFDWMVKVKLKLIPAKLSNVWAARKLTRAEKTQREKEENPIKKGNANICLDQLLWGQNDVKWRKLQWFIGSSGFYYIPTRWTIYIVFFCFCRIAISWILFRMELFSRNFFRNRVPLHWNNNDEEKNSID